MELKVPSVDTWLCNPATVMRNAPSAEVVRVAPDPNVLLNRFDSASDRDWCELVRDVVALANSGGGTITIACAPGETPSDPACPRTIDLAASDIVHRLAHYTDGSFAAVEVRPVDRIAVEINICAAEIPIAFTRAGSYIDREHPAERPMVFSAGTFYFRHGAASEPGNSADMRAVLERSLRQIRRNWLHGIRRVMRLPVERATRRKTQRAAAPSGNPGTAKLQPVRIVNDPNAPALQPQDVDRLYPWRQKDLVRELNARLGRRALNSYDIQAVRRQHHLDDRPDFVFHLEGAGRRYSPAVADWIIIEHARDPEFFRHARAADHEMLRLRRQKPH